jgi:hypothetical protein
MNAPARTFTASLAVREHVPLLLGLMGPSGGGKTYSALRLATGIQSVVGGDIYGIDTEANRMKHYADLFKFKHVPFSAPFGSLDYLAALQFCVSQGAKVIIVDSMSHEHEGPGGLIDLQDQEMHRLAGDDYGTFRAERFNMLAWQKPKAARRRLINGLLQLNANFIFCFRAKETSKPKKVAQDNGRTKIEIVPMGFMPIAGDEFVFEMTMNALLLPHADGVPSWQSDNVGERMMMKLPEQFRRLMEKPRPLDEKMGADLATWARGALPAERTMAGTYQGTVEGADLPANNPHGIEQPSSAAREPEDANNASGGGDLLDPVEEWDGLAWAAKRNAEVARFEANDALEAWWKDLIVTADYKRLKAESPGVAKALKDAVVERSKALAG